MKNKIKAVGYVLGIALSAGVFGTALQFAKAWTEPAAAPPSVSIGAPLTTGSGAQTKTGYVSLAGAMQTPYLYDSNDPFYYLDPNNTSRLKHLNTAGNINTAGYINATGYIEAYDGGSVYGLLNYAGYGGYFSSVKADGNINATGYIQAYDGSSVYGILNYAGYGGQFSSVNVVGPYQTGGGQLRLSSAHPTMYGKLIFSSSNPGFQDYGASIEGSGGGEGVDIGILYFKTGYGIPRTTRMMINSQGYTTFFACHNDLAENYLLSGKAQRGSLVSIDQAQFKTGIASDASHQAIVGIVSTAPGAVMDDSGGFQIGAATKNEYENEKTPIALQGTAPTLVTSQNGNIAIGDAIGISNTPGFGSKMTTAGTIVGKALEKLEPNDTCQVASSIEAINWPTDDGKNSLKPCFKLPDGTIVGKIMVAVNVSWSDPTNFAQKIWAEIANLKDKLLNHEGRLTQLEQENSALKNLVCADHPQAAVCLKN